MMKIVVTGAAGFIGSHLIDRLLQEGHRVVGIDSFAKREWGRHKRQNIADAMSQPNFQLIEQDLLEMDLATVLAEAEIVYHLAAVAGVRQSWGRDFQLYTNMNILATQRLLEACKNLRLGKFIYASSSSVYGGSSGPTVEETPLRPVSPYGVSKLAGEHLVRMYHLNYEVPTTSLRFFTVYGPRQRPDMAFHKFFKAAMDGQSVSVYGTGKQTRDYTYVADVVEANLQIMSLREHGNVFNIGGAERASVLEVIEIIQEVTGRRLQIEHLPKQAGDPLHTWADVTAAREAFGYNPQTGLRAGLSNEWKFIREMYS